MSEFVCSVCSFRSNVKKVVERHINKKKRCTNNEEIAKIIVIEKEIKCEFCSKMYKTIDSLERHKKNFCKIKDKLLQERLKELETANKELETRLKEKEDQISNTSNTTINNTTINNDNRTVINIVINSYKDPSIEHLTDKDYIRAIKRIVMSIPEIIRHIHFNENAPENHNVCITNFKGKFARVFDGKEWRTVDEEVVINTLINDNEYLLEQYAEDNPELQVYIDKYKRIKEANKESVEKETKKEVRTLLYDKRNMVIKMIN
jgi:hypothetical protein